MTAGGDATIRTRTADGIRAAGHTVRRAASSSPTARRAYRAVRRLRGSLQRLHDSVSPSARQARADVERLYEIRRTTGTSRHLEPAELALVIRLSGSQDSRVATQAASLLAVRGQQGRAAESLADLVAREPAAVPAWVQLSEVLTSLGRTAEGHDALLHALAQPWKGRPSSERMATAVLRHPTAEVRSAYRRWAELYRGGKNEALVDATLAALAARSDGADEQQLVAAAAGVPTVAAAVARWGVADGDVALLRTLLDAVLGSAEPQPAWLLDELAESIDRAGHLQLALRATRAAVDAGNTEDPMLRRLQRLESNVELMHHGRPFPPRAEAGIEPKAGTAAYLLHNSLPYHSGGYATRTHGLLSGVIRNGWDVTGLSRPGYPLDQPGHRDATVPESDQVDQVVYRRLLDEQDIPSPGNITRYADYYADRLERWAREHRPAVLHGASNSRNGVAAVEVARRLGLPSVYEVRGLWELTRESREPAYAHSDQYQLSAELEAQACIEADHAFAITEAVRRIMIGRGVPADHITVLPNGVDSSRFLPRPPEEALRARLGLEGRTVVGYVGSVVAYEGLPLLVEAMAELRQAGSDAALVIVGDGTALPQCAERVRQLRLEDDVRLVGRVPHSQVEDYYSIIDIAPFPRLPLPVCEAVSPLKPFEAMAMGKAIVVSDVAALTEIVEDGRTGAAFPKGSASGLAAALAHLAEQPDLRATLGAQAREWVARERDWNVIAQRVTEVYDRLTGA